MARRAIAGSRALVTGASSGIGRQLALELARQGAAVVALARREEQLRQLTQEITARGGTAEFLAGDVTDATVRSQAVELAVRRYGGLDVLVNNAGVGAIGPFAQASPQRLRQVMEVNFFAPAELIRAALPALRTGNRPIVVNIGSILGHRAIPGSSEYCASKFALRGLGESLRAELVPLGIDLLEVFPASTDTEFFQHVVDRQGDVAWRAKRATPADVVARRTVEAIGRGRRQLFPDAKSKLVYWINRLAPSLVDLAVARRRSR